MVNGILEFSDLNPKEQDAVAQLRRRLIGCLSEDLADDLSLFVRFARARELNVNAAESMLRNHIEWRKKVQVENIIANFRPREVMVKYFTFNIIGRDKEGSVILYCDLGHLDAKGLLKAARGIETTRFIIQTLERGVSIMQTESLKRGRLVDQFIMIFNFDELSLLQATNKETLQIIGGLLFMFETQYPERLKTAFAINSSIYFTMGFEVVKHFITRKTYEKIKFFGKEGWKEELLKVIDPEVLPAFLGGNRTDPDGNPLCHSIVTHGTLVSSDYFLNKKVTSLANVPGTKTLTIARMAKHQINLVIDEVGLHIEWTFETKSGDIGFSLLYKKDKLDEGIQVLIPNQRMDANLIAETGMFKCEQLGIYIIQFDNRYSWIHQKEIYYKICLVSNFSQNSGQNSPDD